MNMNTSTITFNNIKKNYLGIFGFSTILAILFRLFGFIVLKTLNCLAFHSLDIEHT